MQQIFYNAKVHTFVDGFPEAEAFLVNDGAIVLVGSKEEVFEMKNDETLLVDLKNKEVFPTFFGIDKSIYSMIEQNLKIAKKDKFLEKLDNIDENYEDFANFQHYKKEFLKIQKQLLSVGITTVQELYMHAKEFAFWKKLSEEKSLEIDVIGYVDIKNAKQVMDDNCRTYRKYRNHFRLGGYSLSLDGSLLDIKAWLKKPYKKEGSYSGFSEYYDEQLSFLIKTAFEEKKQLVVETNGDKAVEQFLRVFEEVIKKEKVEDNLKPIALRCNLLDKKHLLKMKEFGIFPSFDYENFEQSLKKLKGFVGGSRFKKLKPVANASKQGLNVLFERGRTEIENPFELAKLVSGDTDLKLSKHQKVDYNQALKTLTISASNALFDQNEKGTIENGKNATFIVVSNGKIESTYISGEKK